MISTKKLLCFIMSMFLLIGMISPTYYAVENKGSKANELMISDMPDDWSSEALRSAVYNGILLGTDGKIMPDNLLTRAQMAAIMVRIFGATVKGNIDDFTDVKSTDWFADDISKAYHMGIIKGSNGQMNPNKAITREEVFVIISRALRLESSSNHNMEFTDINQISNWAKEDVHAIVESGYVHGSNELLKPKAYMTRAEFAQLIYNLFGQYISLDGTYTDIVDNGNVIVNVPGVTLQKMEINGDLISSEFRSISSNGKLSVAICKRYGRYVYRYNRS